MTTLKTRYWTFVARLCLWLADHISPTYKTLPPYGKTWFWRRIRLAGELRQASYRCKYRLFPKPRNQVELTLHLQIAKAFDAPSVDWNARMAAEKAEKAKYAIVHSYVSQHPLAMHHSAHARANSFIIPVAHDPK